MAGAPPTGQRGDRLAVLLSVVGLSLVAVAMVLALRYLPALAAPLAAALVAGATLVALRASRPALERRLAAVAAIGGLAAILALGLPAAGAAAPVALLAVIAVGLVAFATAVSVAAARRAQAIAAADLERQLGMRAARIRYLLRERQELAALGLHDLQSPIQGTLGLLRTVRHGLGTGRMPAASLEAALAEAEQSCARISAQLDTLLRQQKSRFVDGQRLFDLGGIVDDLLAMHRPEIEAKRLVVRTRRAPYRTVLDGEEIRDILDVVIDNAVRHAPAGTTIRIDIDPAAAAAHAGPAPATDFLVVRVADEGPGVAEDQAAALFAGGMEAIGRARQGMGLFLARRRARSLGGDLAYRPAPGPGATFELRLPCAGRSSPGR